MKGHVLHRARAHIKLPGFSLVWTRGGGVLPYWKALLTKKLPMSLSRLNEIDGGCEKILPVSGSFWSNLEFFRMMNFTAWLWGWNVRVNGILLLFSFWDSTRNSVIQITILPLNYQRCFTLWKYTLVNGHWFILSKGEPLIVFKPIAAS